MLGAGLPGIRDTVLKLRSSPTPEGRCWLPTPRSGSGRVTGCDPHRPRRAGAGPSRRARPSRCGTCCDPHRPRRAGAGTGNPLRITAVHSCDPHRPRRAGAGCGPGSRCRSRCRRCDPHRPRRAGAGPETAVPVVAGPELRSSPTPEGRCWLQPLQRGSRRCLQRCDPHRPRRAVAGISLTPIYGGYRVLRSSPTPEGRCWLRVAAVDPPDLPVAILTDPGGPVLAAELPGVYGWVHVLRSSPTPEGRCWPHVVAQLADPGVVAILTDPGGPVLVRPTHLSECSALSCDPHRPRRAGAGSRDRVVIQRRAQVAILTDPGGPVLADDPAAGRPGQAALRSSPTPEGRCWPQPITPPIAHTSLLRSSPTPEGRCWRAAPRDHVVRGDVAILTDPGGPVLERLSPAAGPQS